MHIYLQAESVRETFAVAPLSCKTSDHDFHITIIAQQHCLLIEFDHRWKRIGRNSLRTIAACAYCGSTLLLILFSLTFPT